MSYQVKNSPNLDHEYEVVSCFIEYKGKFLILQRAKRDLQYGLWGIPGGKLEEQETSIEGLQRELLEETGIKLSSKNFCLLGQIHMSNQCDGYYLLHIYYTSIDHLPKIQLRKKEHSGLKWVSFEEFKRENLLFCQGKAFDYVKHDLLKAMGRKNLSFLRNHIKKEGNYA